MLSPARVVVRRDGGMDRFEAALRRRGFAAIAGADEAGRGACAGPLVTAAVLLRRPPPFVVADSKVLSPDARAEAYERIVCFADAFATVVVPPEAIDSDGLHVCNVRALRQAVARLAGLPDYILLDGFAVAGLPSPSLAMWKGDQVTTSVAAASIVAKVTRDRMMVALDDRFPGYDFAKHKGYSTPEHAAALRRHGPSPVHRLSYANVRAHLHASPTADPKLVDPLLV